MCGVDLHVPALHLLAFRSQSTILIRLPHGRRGRARTGARNTVLSKRVDAFLQTGFTTGAPCVASLFWSMGVPPHTRLHFQVCATQRPHPS